MRGVIGEFEDFVSWVYSMMPSGGQVAYMVRWCQDREEVRGYAAVACNTRQTRRDIASRSVLSVTVRQDRIGGPEEGSWRIRCPLDDAV